MEIRPKFMTKRATYLIVPHFLNPLIVPLPFQIVSDGSRPGFEPENGSFYLRKIRVSNNSGEILFIAPPKENRKIVCLEKSPIS